MNKHEQPEYARMGDNLDINPRAALLQRHPRKVAADQALAELHQKLAISTVIYEQHGDAGKEGAFRALGDVIDYLQSQGLPVPALLPLFDLATGLRDLERRVTPPLFAARKAGGRPPKSGADARLDALLAIVMECCVRHFRDYENKRDFLNPARRLAATLINQSGLGLHVTKERMEDVRELVTAQGPDEPSRSLFDELMLDVEADPPALTWARRFVASGWVPLPKVSE